MTDQHVSCLDCGAAFDEADANRIHTGDHDRCFVTCTACGAVNELRADRMPGLGEPPRAVAVRVVRE